jgi:hypothetical protein
MKAYMLKIRRNGGRIEYIVSGSGLNSIEISVGFLDVGVDEEPIEEGNSEYGRLLL